jgi:hypothetical protein
LSSSSSSCDLIIIYNISDSGVFSAELTASTVFSPEAQYYTYKRRLKALRTDPEEYQRQKAETKHFYRDAETPILEQPQIPRENINRMVQELEQTYVSLSRSRSLFLKLYHVSCVMVGLCVCSRRGAWWRQ